MGVLTDQGLVLGVKIGSVSLSLILFSSEQGVQKSVYGFIMEVCGSACQRC